MAIDSNKAQQQASELSTQLWAIANDLRGGMDANEFRNYILGTIFYRYLSERTEMYMQEICRKMNFPMNRLLLMQNTDLLWSNGALNISAILSSRKTFLGN